MMTSAFFAKPTVKLPVTATVFWGDGGYISYFFIDSKCVFCIETKLGLKAPLMKYFLMILMIF
jgi:hypothetical protein